MELTAIVDEPVGGSGRVGEEGEEGEPRLTALGPLRSTNKLTIKQKVQTCEILTGCEQENRFTIASPLGDIIYWAKEQSGFCNRYCTVHILASLENIFTSGDYKLTSIFPSDDYTATNSLVIMIFTSGEYIIYSD